MGPGRGVRIEVRSGRDPRVVGPVGQLGDDLEGEQGQRLMEGEAVLQVDADRDHPPLIVRLVQFHDDPSVAQ